MAEAQVGLPVDTPTVIPKLICGQATMQCGTITLLLLQIREGHIVPAATPADRAIPDTDIVPAATIAPDRAIPDTAIAPAATIAPDRAIRATAIAPAAIIARGTGTDPAALRGPEQEVHSVLVQTTVLPDRIIMAGLHLTLAIGVRCHLRLRVRTSISRYMWFRPSQVCSV